MTRIAIIGYGNTGKGVHEAIISTNDLSLAGIILRNKLTAKEKGIPEGIPVAENINELGTIDAAILCTPTKTMPGLAVQYLAKGICTVDSYDLHASIYDVLKQLDPIAKQHKTAAITAAGWDPGSDSVIRGLLEAIAPRGLTYTNFGPGMSLGHTVAAKAIPGVKDALSITIPLGTGLHRRIVYIEPMENENREDIKKRLLNDAHFKNDETHVIFTTDIQSLADKGHGVNVTRKAASGTTDNQLFNFNMTIHGGALTGQVLTAAARAVVRQKPGCYTMIEIPVIDLMTGDREGIIRRLV